MRWKRGFTAVELLIGMVVAGIAAGIIVQVLVLTVRRWPL